MLYFKIKNFDFRILKQFLHQPQAMFICYPTIYDMTMLACISYMKRLIEWKYPVYPDSILNSVAISRIRTKAAWRWCECICNQLSQHCQIHQLPWLSTELNLTRTDGLMLKKRYQSLENGLCFLTSIIKTLRQLGILKNYLLQITVLLTDNMKAVYVLNLTCICIDRKEKSPCLFGIPSLKTSGNNGTLGKHLTSSVWIYTCKYVYVFT
jgi:hypothetical protein